MDREEEKRGGKGRRQENIPHYNIHNHLHASISVPPFLFEHHDIDNSTRYSVLDQFQIRPQLSFSCLISQHPH